MKTNNSPLRGPQSLNIVYRLPVKDDSPLLDFLCNRLKDLSKSKIKSYLGRKCVLVDGNAVSQFDFALHRGMTVEIVRRNDNPLSGNRFIRLVHEDRWLVVIEKHTGILSMQSDHHSFCIKTLLDQYFDKTHQRCTAHLVHRLDRDTSGLMIFAKSTEVQQMFEQDWRRLIQDRRYVAVVSGIMEQREGTVRSWLKDDKFFFTYSSPTDNGGKYAVTHFHTLASNGRYSLVELQLETGRKNQIRVHMQDLHHPVVGDKKYGLEGDDPLGRLGLHAFRLFFTHPVTGQPMRFETPFPPNFTALFEEKN